jgi:hypothetical protein
MNLQDHANLYRSSPPLPEIEHLGNLKPSAYHPHRIKHRSINPVIDDEGDDTDDDLTLVDFLKKSSMSIAQEDTSLPGGELLPIHPKKPRVTALKRKATIFAIDDDDNEQPR